jgi:hypothetical protein
MISFFLAISYRLNEVLPGERVLGGDPSDATQFEI